MAVDDHPMRALKGTPAAKKLMQNVRAHKGAKPEAKTPPKSTSSYRDIAGKHLGA